MVFSIIIISFTISVIMMIHEACIRGSALDHSQSLSLFVSHSQAGSTRSSLDYAVMVQSASGIEADINQGLSREKMKLHYHFTGAAQLLDTSLLLICWTFHTIT